jgi:hypothetical protein
VDFVKWPADLSCIPGTVLPSQSYFITAMLITLVIWIFRLNLCEHEFLGSDGGEDVDAGLLGS